MMSLFQSSVSQRSVLLCTLLTPLLGLSACMDLELSGDEVSALSQQSTEVSLEWLIIDQDRMVSCIDVGATEVEVALLGESEHRYRTSCFGGFAVVESTVAGRQAVEVSLISPDDEVLVTVELGEVELVTGATVPLGAVELKF